jgi:circadian clock protein KaiC
LSQEGREKATAVQRQNEAERKERELTRKREALEARIAALRKEFESEEEEAETVIGQESTQEKLIAANREAMTRSRQADVDSVPAASKKTRRSQSEKVGQS